MRRFKCNFLDKDKKKSKKNVIINVYIKLILLYIRARKDKIIKNNLYKS